jgi:Flp pilus assembly pilin Flp
MTSLCSRFEPSSCSARHPVGSASAKISRNQCLRATERRLVLGHRVQRSSGRVRWRVRDNARQRGVSTVEYVVLLVLIAALALATWRVFGQRVQARLSGATDRITVLDDALLSSSEAAGLGVAEPSPPGPGTPAGATASPPSSSAAAKAALVHSLVQTQGGATAADAAAVERELSKLPDKALKTLQA